MHKIFALIFCLINVPAQAQINSWSQLKSDWKDAICLTELDSQFYGRHFSKGEKTLVSPKDRLNELELNFKTLFKIEKMAGLPKANLELLTKHNDQLEKGLIDWIRDETLLLSKNDAKNQGKLKNLASIAFNSCMLGGIVRSTCQDFYLISENPKEWITLFNSHVAAIKKSGLRQKFNKSLEQEATKFEYPGSLEEENENSRDVYEVFVKDCKDLNETGGEIKKPASRAR